MPLDTAEKARINRSFDFLTDPNELRQRQLVYDRLGLRSFEVAEAEADFRRASRLRSMSAREQQFGTPEIDTVPGGERRTFTEPSGVKRRFEGGVQTSMQLPLLREYSPRDQKRIKQKYEERSAIATDPDMTPEEKQAGLDQVDAFISSIPHISPMMQEPTPQQKVDANTVTIDNVKYFYDGKTLKPIVDPKQQQAEKDDYNVRLYKNIDLLRKNNDDILITNPADKMDDPQLIEMARAMTDNETGRAKSRKTSFIPALNGLWTTTMADLNESNNFANKRATEAQMLEAMGHYTRRAIEKGAREVDAKADFLKRWQSEQGGGPHFNLVPRMSATTTNKAQFVQAGTIREDEPPLFGLRRGEAKVTVHEQELPPEVDAIWGSLSNADKKTIRKELASGANKLLPVSNRRIKMSKGGEEFYIKIVQLEEAMASGYKVVN